MGVKCLRYIGKIIVAGVIAIFVLSGFSYVYSFSGVHVYNETRATDYKWMSRQYKATMTEGFSWMRMDADGFNNVEVPEKEQINILLMGSSHIEAVNVKPSENIGYLLNEKIPDKYTYNIGMSGHTIYTCVQNLENALKEYAPTEYVIIETDTIHMDTDSMQAVISGNYPEIPSYDSGGVYLIQKNIPVIKALYKQMDAWISQDISNDITENVESAAVVQNDGLTSSFLHKIAQISSKYGVKPVLIYHPVVTIDAKGDAVVPDEKDSRNSFANLCEDENIIFVDMTEDFVSLYEEQHILAHGFVNTAVGSGHLNRYGHASIAKRLSEVIEERADGN